MSRYVAIAVAVALVAVGILAVYLFLELGESNDQLAATRTTLASTQTDLTNTQSTLTTTQTTLQETSVVLDAQKEANTTLQAENAGLDASLADALAANAEFAATNDGLKAENADLHQGLRAASDLAQRTRIQLNSLETDYEALTLMHSEVSDKYQTLSDSVATVTVLEATADRLRQEIAELRTLRQPLILGAGDWSRSGFSCTGSMEPKITCLDEATWIYDFQPEDIVVGATIAYAPACWRDQDDPDIDRGVAHRVMEIEIRDGVHYYWPKGDNNREADGCWVPHTDVRGYISELHKNARPENAELRGYVNEARADLDETEEALDAAWATLEERRVEYRAIIDRYCGVGVLPHNCTLPDHQYNEAIAVWRDLQFDRWRYDTALAQYDGALEYWTCWRDTARSAERPYPGVAPLFPHCIPPLVILPPPPIV